MKVILKGKIKAFGLIVGSEVWTLRVKLSWPQVESEFLNALQGLQDI